MDWIEIYQVDAFTSELFSGNPAAVCPLDTWLPEPVMQQIAAENNLSETAFLVANDAGYDLRWFTPQFEVDLCGHATLAAGFVVLNFLQPSLDRITFQTRSGELAVARSGRRLAMDLPARPPIQESITEDITDALGAEPESLWRSRDLMAVYDTEAQVRSLSPDQNKLAEIKNALGVIVTAPGELQDFVSRFFVPNAGIPEDPVTGSAHSTLVPYWSHRLGKTTLNARQISARGGDLDCDYQGDTVRLTGDCVLYLKGQIAIPDAST